MSLEFKNQSFLAINHSKTTGSIRMALNKIHGDSKNATTAYVFYCNEKQLLVAQMYPDRSKSDISNMMSAQWTKLSAAEKQPFAYKNIGDKLRYQRKMEAFNVVVGAEKVVKLEEADKVEHEGKKRKKAIENVDQDAAKRQQILDLNASLFEGMASSITTDDTRMFAATNGKAAISARPAEDQRPAYYFDDYVDVVEDLSPNNNRPHGKVWIVGARGTGTGTIVDVAYCKAYDDGPTILPNYYPLKGVDEITQSFGRVHRSILFKSVTILPILIGRRDITKAKHVRTNPTSIDADLE